LIVCKSIQIKQRLVKKNIITFRKIRREDYEAGYNSQLGQKVIIIRNVKL